MAVNDQGAQQAFEVAIVGAGPCGLMLAIELGRRGIRTLVLDDKASAKRFPAANATQARTMEHYRRLGFADAIRAEGLPPDYPTDIAYFTRYTKHELARISLPSARAAREMVRNLSGSWSAAELPHRVSQMFVEKVLRAQAEACASVSIRSGWRMSTVEERGDHVVVEAEAVDGSAREAIRAAYVVGTDGGGSPTRKSLGIRFSGEGGAKRDYMGGRMGAVHLRCPTLYDAVPHPKAWMYVTVSPATRALLAAIDGQGEFAFHSQIKGGGDELTHEGATALFHEAVGAAMPLEILSHSTWNAGYTLVAEGFGRGRILLGGDAVHLFTPTGGLGYNTAVEDAVNLGWKLAAVLRGYGGPALLDSYEIERKALALRNTGYARGFADSVGLFMPTPELEQDGPDGDAARASAGEFLNAHARAEFNIPGVTFGGRYDGSPVIVPDGTTPPPDAANVYVPSACPGGRAPHLWLDDGRSLYDAFGFEFTLLRLGSRAPSADGFAAAAKTLGVPLTIVDVPMDAARDLYEADLALIRPDQIVAWRGVTDTNADAVLRRTLGSFV